MEPGHCRNYDSFLRRVGHPSLSLVLRTLFLLNYIPHLDPCCKDRVSLPFSFCSLLPSHTTIQHFGLKPNCALLYHSKPCFLSSTPSPLYTLSCKHLFSLQNRSCHLLWEALLTTPPQSSPPLLCPPGSHTGLSQHPYRTLKGN